MFGDWSVFFSYQTLFLEIVTDSYSQLANHQLNFVVAGTEVILGNDNHRILLNLGLEDPRTFFNPVSFEKLSEISKWS